MSTQTSNTFVELHLLQSFAPANLNRDDTGSPKDCEFGGIRRARISSQALKRAIRKHPRFTAMTGVDNGTRSKWLTRPIIQALTEQHGKDMEQAVAVATSLVANYQDKKEGKMDADNPQKTKVLIFFAQSEVDQIVATLLENWDIVIAETKDGKKLMTKLASDLIKTTKDRTSAPDVALFGRMLASSPELNIDAACQVSHAISTHRVTMEMDYYTAVDELLKDEEAGAGMVGFTGFNSACFYRYARIDWGQLVKNLGDITLAHRTVEAFLRAALDAIPTGKQNAFAAQNPTSLACAILRHDGMSWNLANAFETPVAARNEQGYIGGSIHALDQLWGALMRFYDDAEIAATSVFVNETYQSQLSYLAAAQQPTVSTWLATVSDALPKG